MNSLATIHPVLFFLTLALFYLFSSKDTEKLPTTLGGQLRRTFLHESQNCSRCEALSELLFQEDRFPFPVQCSEVHSAQLQGFPEEVPSFHSCIKISTGISSIPFVAYIFELESTIQRPAFVSSLLCKADRSWHFAAGEDEFVCEAVNRLVLFAMVPPTIDAEVISTERESSPIPEAT